jgi:hypothetical protein
MTVRSLSFTTGINSTSHRFRATFLSVLDEGGVQEGVAIELAGHEQVTVYRKHYAPVREEAKDDAILVVDYGVNAGRSIDLGERRSWDLRCQVDDLRLGLRYTFRLKTGSVYIGKLTGYSLELLTVQLTADERVEFPRDAVALVLEPDAKKPPVLVTGGM